MFDSDEETDPLQIASRCQVDEIQKMNPKTDSLYLQVSKAICGDVKYGPVLRFLTAEII